MRRVTRKPNCICDSGLPVNAYRANGQPIAIWTCPEHGNVFEDRASSITLTPFQRDVLQAISDEYKAGRSASSEAVSWIVNRTVGAVEKEMIYLRAINFIEPNSSAVGQGERS
jgi:hypothetical protein